MAVIGTFGDIVFSVSPKEIKTFESMKWNSSAKYATHNRHLKDDLLEFTGRNTDTISFKMNFSVFLGVNPLKEIDRLLDAERQGKVSRLVIGGKSYGEGKWVIEKTTKDLERFDNKGNLLIAKVSVSLKEYARR